MNTTPDLSGACRISWRAILAGTVAAVSVHLLLVMLGTGISALVARNVDDDAGAVKALATGTTVAWCLSALLSLCVGGWIAGKVGASGDADSGKMHGFVVWSLATVGAFLLMMLGMGGAVAGAAGLVKDAASGVGKIAAEAAPNIAQETKTMINGFSDEVNVGDRPLAPRAKRELAAQLKSLFAADSVSRPQLRTAAVNTLTAGGVPAAEAGATVDEWVATYDRVRAETQAAATEAAATAREAADRTARTAGIASIWIFVAFWAGALASIFGGHLGAKGWHRNAVTHPARVPVHVT